MPVARGVTTMPVVAIDEQGRADLRMPIGLDRESGLIFRIPPALRSRDAEGGADAARRRGGLIGGCAMTGCATSATDEQGKAVLIAMALTIIQRHDFTERPDFFLSAAKAGTGKTTAANMVSAAVLGHRAAATAWSTSAEERRKACLRSSGRAPRLVVFDNFKRGTEIHDETVEKIQTSRRYSDRRLGESEQQEGDACTVLAWTGNKIAPKSDSASRNLLVRSRPIRCGRANGR